MIIIYTCEAVVGQSSADCQVRIPPAPEIEMYNLHTGIYLFNLNIPSLIFPLLSPSPVFVFTLGDSLSLGLGDMQTCLLYFSTG